VLACATHNSTTKTTIKNIGLSRRKSNGGLSVGMEADESIAIDMA
jgi:hypothetical protein